MNKILCIISVFLMFGCNQLADNNRNSTDSPNPDSSPAASTSGNIIWSEKPATEWVEGYPIGNGRIGGMILGGIEHERIALNHDLLWRQFWTYQKHSTAGDISKIRNHCLNGEWDEAEAITLSKVAVTGQPVYVNPYVPAGDLYIDMKDSNHKVRDYVRSLNMNNGIVEVRYTRGDVKYKRESFCSWEKGLLVTHLSSNRAGVLTGEVSLSRLPDPECVVTGYSALDKVILEGEFEEGRKFAVVAKIIQRGGRLTGGKKEYDQSKVEMPGKNFGLEYVFRKDGKLLENSGASTCFDAADEVLILLSITIDDEVGNGTDLVKTCIEKIDKVKDNYEAIKQEHISDHQELYRRVTISLGQEGRDIATDSLVKTSVQNNEYTPALLEKMFNFSRYLAISSGRPQADGFPSKAPINLQGIWNQDRRPAWDCDYHLDLNVEMCYWPLDLVNLGDLMNPLMDWVERMMPQGRIAAKDLYGCDGVYFPPTCDNSNIGNVDNIGFYWSGGAAWIAQLLWQHYEYSCNQAFLEERLFPFMLEISEFYEDFLIKNSDGYLIPSLSTSPEMPIAGRKMNSFVSSTSTMDLELIRDLYTHLAEAGRSLEYSGEALQKWDGILEKLPLPKIDDDGSLAEWMEDHIPGDPGHRHRSQFVGLSPGDRISVESTPDYAEAAYLALKKRHSYGRDMTQSLTFVWDAQILARLNKGNEAYDELRSLFSIHVLDNLLITCNDWEGKGGLAWFPDIKLFQIEANIGIASSIIEMIFQDRQGLLRFLPALPAELPQGRVTGLRARGGFELGLRWDDGEIISANIISLDGQTCHFKDNGFDKVKIMCQGEEVEYARNINKGLISFETHKGYEYKLTF